MNPKSMLMGMLGLSERNVVRAAFFSVIRRFAISSYTQGDRFESPSDEIKRFFNDKAYRKMLVEGGKSLEVQFGLQGKLKTTLLGAFGEHSAVFEELGEQFSESGNVRVDDDIVDLAVGEGINALRTLVGMDLGDEAFTGSLSTSASVGSNTDTLVATLKSSFNLNKEVLFPDICEHLTHVDCD